MLERDGSASSTTISRRYAIGDDVLAQIATAHGFGSLLSDGHGSTRQLYTSTGIDQPYDYDAYGEAFHYELDKPDSSVTRPRTDLLYAGEQWDADLGMQYLRARYYLPGQGIFNRLDPFFGNLDDPQSLHKYAYVHGDPVNGIDPSGLFTTAEFFSAVSLGVKLGAVTGGVVGAAYGYAKTRTLEGALYGLVIGASIGAFAGAFYGGAIYSLGSLWASAAGITVAEGQLAAAILLAIPDRILAFLSLAESLRRGDDVDTTFSIIGILSSYGALSFVATSLASRLPNRMVRVVDLDVYQNSTNPQLSAPGQPEAWVTGAADLEGINSARQIAQRLTLLNSDGTLNTSPKVLIEFDAPIDGIAVPVLRENPGFIPGGYTAGAAREFVIPNAPVSTLQNVQTRIVP